MTEKRLMDIISGLEVLFLKPDKEKLSAAFKRRLVKDILKEQELDEAKIKEMENAITFHRKEGQSLAHACHDYAQKIDDFRQFLRKLDTATDNFRTALINQYFDNEEPVKDKDNEKR